MDLFYRIGPQGKILKVQYKNTGSSNPNKDKQTNKHCLSDSNNKIISKSKDLLDLQLLTLLSLDVFFFNFKYSFYMCKE